MSDTCTCGGNFLDAEDFRDHLPCPGTDGERAIDALFDLVRKADDIMPYVVADPVLTKAFQYSRDRAFVLLRSRGYWK